MKGALVGKVGSVEARLQSCKEGLLKELKTILDLCAKEPVYWNTPILEWGSNLLSK